MTTDNKKRKYWYISIVVIISFTLILYIIELLTAIPIFNIMSFNLNYVISLPFILLSLIINSCVGIIINRTISRKQPVFMRIVVNSALSVLVAVILVIIGNFPFISDMIGFVKTIEFWKSVAAMTLLNIIILIAAVDYMMQMVTNRNLQKENAILQYRQLKSQINPHFLFNSLNVLVSTINKDRDAAVEYTKNSQPYIGMY